MVVYTPFTTLAPVLDSVAAFFIPCHDLSGVFTISRVPRAISVPTFRTQNIIGRSSFSRYFLLFYHLSSLASLLGSGRRSVLYFSCAQSADALTISD